MKSNVCIIDEILLKVYKNKNNIIISINRKMPIRILTSNNRIIIKENFAIYSYQKDDTNEYPNIFVSKKQYE